VYTNFIASLDGRISLPDPRTARRRVPVSIANARDWRLFQELAACADALVVSGSHVRNLPRGVTARSFPVGTKPEHADLLDWRRSQGLDPQPAVVIVTASVNLPPLGALVEARRRVYVATGSAADASAVASVEAQGVRVLRVGAGARVEGDALVATLAREGHLNVAMLSGGELLETLVAGDVLDRLYLTVACRLVGGTVFDTLFTGPALAHAKDFKLTALHYDAEAGAESAPAQLFAILDRR
jgi:riboflavin biosynthesis pyrimidine reductase